MEYPHLTEDLPQEKSIATVGNRPLVLQILFLAMGVALVIFARSYWHVGTFFTLMAIVSLVVVKDYTACKIYRQRIAILNPDDQSRMRLVDYDEIISYNVDPKNQACVIIQVAKGMETEYLTVQTFNAARVKSKLFKLIPDKDHDTMRIKNFQSNLGGPRKKKKDK